ncbi:hypothetical protein GN244_ATG17819 [Phytophthora infestans]|uniref:Uncharacterized protein n=1 Tax=Phytophthora infestans TaxID=4787 RepID=A0A833SGL6_PHYIN|nr:hypothetical protein GN244_ATG17819 [Phytophthora infestans]KAF4133503.1 hypothetical protein GN958_ATG17308 [Phytophthora infestans]
MEQLGQWSESWSRDYLVCSDGDWSQRVDWVPSEDAELCCSARAVVNQTTGHVSVAMEMQEGAAELADWVFAWRWQ